ncbi:MAG TPA: hypothetical protein IAA29_12045 [Candidatus Paenibacillus intestinavium]|nr:hypothetical protein [Candidatus Paenibacillus intestinavium]
MINSIRIHNAKGKTLTQPLTGMDIFIGPNGSGKSAIQQMVGYAMLGYVPGEGKKIQDTFELSSGDVMSAGLQTGSFSFDRTIKRSEKLNGDGKTDIKYSESLTVSPNLGEKTNAQLEARVTSEIGSFPVVFDFSVFTELSDAKKRDYMYSLSPITNDSWTRERVETHLREHILTEVLKVNSPEVYEAANELIGEALSHWPQDYELTSGLQAVISWIDGQQKEWNKKKSDAVGAVRELNDMKNELEETDRGISLKKEELVRLRIDHTDVHGQITAGRELKRQWDANQQRISDYKNEIAFLSVKLTNVENIDYESKIQTIKEQIQQTDISVESEGLQKQMNALQFNKMETEEKVAQINSEISKLEAELHTYDTVIRNIQEKGASVCVLNNAIACDKDFSGFINFANDNGSKIRSKISDLNGDKDSLKVGWRDFNSQSNDIEQRKMKLHEQFMSESQNNDKLRNEIETFRQEERNAQQLHQNNLNRQIMLQGELNRLIGEPMPAFAPLDILEPQLEALTNQIAEAERVIEEKEKAKTTLSNKQQAMMSASKAQYYFKACQKISLALGAKGVQGELVKSILGPIEEAVNVNLRLMGINLPCFFSTESETGKEVFQFGWIKNERRMKFNALSKGEKLMFLSAFLVTLIERANPKLKVLALDEIQNLDKTNLRNVLNGLNALSHKLDNIIIAGVVENIPLEGWTYWDLTPQSDGDWLGLN